MRPHLFSPVLLATGLRRQGRHLSGEHRADGGHERRPLLRELKVHDVLGALAQLRPHRRRRTHDTLQQVIPHGRLVRLGYLLRLLILCRGGMPT